jgi:hypothetical protein
MKAKEKEVANVSEMIRQHIAALPSEYLERAKPADILPQLEAAGVEITPSIRSMTSKLLSAARRRAGNAGSDPQIPGINDGLWKAAFAFIKACGSLQRAKRMLEILEEVERLE